MIKKIRLFLLISVFSLSASLPSLSMNQEDKELIIRINKKISKYQRKIEKYTINIKDLNRILQQVDIKYIPPFPQLPQYQLLQQPPLFTQYPPQNQEPKIFQSLKAPPKKTSPIPQVPMTFLPITHQTMPQIPQKQVQSILPTKNHDHLDWVNVNEIPRLPSMPPHVPTNQQPFNPNHIPPHQYPLPQKFQPFTQYPPQKQIPTNITYLPTTYHPTTLNPQYEIQGQNFLNQQPFNPNQITYNGVNQNILKQQSQNELDGYGSEEYYEDRTDIVLERYNEDEELNPRDDDSEDHDWPST